MNTIEFTTDELLNKGRNFVVNRILTSDLPSGKPPINGNINFSIIQVGIDVGGSILLSSAFNYITTEARNKKIYPIGNILDIVEVFINLNLEKNIALVMTKKEYLKIERTEKLKKLNNE
mgnify:CR=1 FL=1